LGPLWVSRGSTRLGEGEWTCFLGTLFGGGELKIIKRIGVTIVGLSDPLVTIVLFGLVGGFEAG
jgi:hypothetical protein